MYQVFWNTGAAACHAIWSPVKISPVLMWQHPIKSVLEPFLEISELIYGDKFKKRSVIVSLLNKFLTFWYFDH